MRVYYPGEIAPKNGSYCIVDKNGMEYIGMVIKLKEGEIFPPAEKDGHGYTVCGN